MRVGLASGVRVVVVVVLTEGDGVQLVTTTDGDGDCSGVENKDAPRSNTGGVEPVGVTGRNGDTGSSHE